MPCSAQTLCCHRPLRQPPRLRLAERQQLGKRHTANTEAHRLYLKGRYFWNKRTPDSLLKAIAYFQQAIKVG